MFKQANSLIARLQSRAASQPGLGASQQASLRKAAWNLRAAMGLCRPPLEGGLKPFPGMGSSQQEGSEFPGFLSPVTDRERAEAGTSPLAVASAHAVERGASRDLAQQAAHRGNGQCEPDRLGRPQVLH